MVEDNKTEEKRSFVLVEFTELGSVFFNIVLDNVTPLQVLAMSQYLEVRAKNELIMQENARLDQQKEMQIAVPKSSIITER